MQLRPGFDPWVGKIPWRREWKPIPAFLPGEFRGQRGLAGYSPQGHKESDTTERLKHTQNKEHSTSQGYIPSRFCFFLKSPYTASQFDLGTWEVSFIIDGISALVSQEGRR